MTQYSRGETLFSRIFYVHPQETAINAFLSLVLVLSSFILVLLNTLCRGQRKKCHSPRQRRQSREVNRNHGRGSVKNEIHAVRAQSGGIARAPPARSLIMFLQVRKGVERCE